MLSSLAIAALLMAPGFVLLWMGHRLAGMVWLFVAAFALMLRTYRKPWRLGFISCLIPPVMAGACYAFQMWLFGEVAPLELIALAASIGLVIGYVRANSHSIRQGDKGAPLADRTAGYLVIWVVAYAATQAFAYLAVDSFGTRAGLVTGAFSTAMLAAVSVVIWLRFRAMRSQVATAVLIGALLFTGVTPVDQVQAQSSFTRECYDRDGNIRTRNVTDIDPTCPFGETPVRPLPSEGVDENCDTAVGCLNRPPTRAVPVGPGGGGMVGESGPDTLTSSGDASIPIEDPAASGEDAGAGSQSLVDALVELVGDAQTLPEDQDQIAAVTAAATALMIAAGVAVSTAQAVAAAIANAMQAGAQMTAEEIQAAIGDALRGRTDREASAPEGQERQEGTQEKPPPESEEERAERESRERAERDREDWKRDKVRREQEAARLTRIQDLALELGDEDLIERTVSQRIYRPDGSIDTEYLDRLQEIIRARLGRNEATSDPDFEDNSWSRIVRETLDETLDEARDSFIARAGLGALTGNRSEIIFQADLIIDKIREAAERAEDKGEVMSRADALRIVFAELANENLPVATVQALERMRQGENVGGAELGMSLFADAMAMADVGEAGQKITGVSPGEAFDSVSRKVLPTDVYQRGRANVGEIRDGITGLAAKVQDLEARGTEWLNRKTGGQGEHFGFGNPDRMSPAQARAQLEEGRVSLDTQAKIDEVQSTGVTGDMDEAHASGRQRGEQKVDEFEQSLARLEEARKGGDAAAIAEAQQDVRDNLLRVQGDKHGMNALNGRNVDGTGHRTIESFNREMGATHGQTDEAVRQRLAEMYGVRPEDVQVVNITNEAGGGPRADWESPGRPDAGLASRKTPQGTIENGRGARSEPGTIDGPETGRLPDPEPSPPRRDKAGMDRDLTMRVRTVVDGKVVYRDVPSTVTGRIYNEEFYRAATGREPPPFDPDRHSSTDFIHTHLDEDGFLADPAAIDDPQTLARRSDQATTDRTHAEAYGTGQGDLDTATKDSYRHRDLSDAAGTAKTIEFKVDHWMQDADRLREMAAKPENAAIRGQLLEQASAHMEEAQRQLVKQYGNMVVTRTEAMRMFGNAPGARIPSGMADKVNVLRQVQQGRITPAQGEEALKRMGSSTQQLARQMSAYVEGLQTLRAPGGYRPKTGGSPFPVQGWQDEFREEKK
ncbi:hypothetical protein ACI5KX_13445 [Erythrobacter sp. GH1-10]|uniref:hypothetical protein n=1 Tax=Erythrobacter sp. GH1-10 TaxID=3349334 RepID=UPI003877AF97